MSVSVTNIGTGERRARDLAVGQGIYFISTGLWPVVHLESFLAVTGSKTDLWLVQAFGLLVAAIGAALLSFSIFGRADHGAGRFGFASAVMLAFIDVFFVARRAIPPVYLLDAVPEIALATGWLMVGKALLVAARFHQR
jgi:hypothetical protein